MIDSLQKRIIDNGAVPPVVRHVSSSSPNNQRMALQTLQNLAIDGNVDRPCLCKPRIYPLLSSYTDVGKSVIHANGGVERVIGVLRQGNVDLIPHALRVTINLTGDCKYHCPHYSPEKICALNTLFLSKNLAKVRRAFVDAGALRLVEDLQNHRDPNVSATAKQALNNLRLPC